MTLSLEQIKEKYKVISNKEKIKCGLLTAKSKSKIKKFEYQTDKNSWLLVREFKISKNEV